MQNSKKIKGINRRPKISLVICTKNRPTELSRCLESVLSQKVLPNELVIIEDVSDRSCFFKISRKLNLQSKIKIVHVKVKYRNISKSRNYGIKHSTGDIILFADDDTILFSNTIQTIHFLYVKYPNAICFVGRILPFSNDIFSIFQAKYVMGDINQNKVYKMAYFCGIMFSVKKRFIEKNKIFFNEIVHSNAGEDVDFFERINQSGGVVYYHPKLAVMHGFRTGIINFIRTYFHYWSISATLQSEYPNHFNFDYAFPRKKIHVLLFPLWFMKLVYGSTKTYTKKLKLGYRFYPLTILHWISSYMGLYISPAGKKRLFLQVKKILSGN